MVVTDGKPHPIELRVRVLCGLGLTHKKLCRRLSRNERMSSNWVVSGLRSVSPLWPTIWNGRLSSTRHRSRPTSRRPPAGSPAGSVSSTALRSASGAADLRCSPASRSAGRAMGHQRRHERRDVRSLRRNLARSDASGRGCRHPRQPLKPHPEREGRPSRSPATAGATSRPQTARSRTAPPPPGSSCPLRWRRSPAASDRGREASSRMLASFTSLHSESPSSPRVNPKRDSVRSQPDLERGYLEQVERGHR